MLNQFAKIFDDKSLSVNIINICILQVIIVILLAQFALKFIILLKLISYYALFSIDIFHGNKRIKFPIKNQKYMNNV